VSEAFPPVLVIDDSDIARSQIAQRLAEEGIEVHTLPSAIGATRAVLRNNIGLVLIDVLMPAMRGDRLAALFRKNARFSNIGLILVSSEPEGQLKRLADEVGADGVVSKSNLDGLVPALRRVLRKVAADG
jgi:CheY-like chemotaxis protein